MKHSTAEKRREGGSIFLGCLFSESLFSNSSDLFCSLASQLSTRTYSSLTRMLSRLLCLRRARKLATLASLTHPSFMSIDADFTTLSPCLRQAHLSAFDNAFDNCRLRLHLFQWPVRQNPKRVQNQNPKRVQKPKTSSKPKPKTSSKTQNEFKTKTQNEFKNPKRVQNQNPKRVQKPKTSSKPKPKTSSKTQNEFKNPKRVQNPNPK